MPDPSSTDFAAATHGAGALVSVTIVVVGLALAAEAPDDSADDAVSAVVGSPHADSPTAARQSNTPKPGFRMSALCPNCKAVSSDQYGSSERREARIR